MGKFPRSIHIKDKETLRNFLAFCFFVLLQNLTFLFFSLEFSLRAK